MPTLSASEASTYNRKRIAGFVLVLLGGIVCLVHLYSIHTKLIRYMGIDFEAVYSSSRCVIAGCNPYDSEDLKAQFVKQGGLITSALTPPSGGPFQPHYVGYPPPTLFFFVPFALLRWPLAWFVYLVVGIALYAVAVALFAELCSKYVPVAASALLGLFLAVEWLIVELAQPTLLAAALLCIGVWCLLKNRYPRLGVLSFAFSLALKPPLGALFLLYFLLANSTYRRRAWQVIGLTVVLCIPGVAWFSTHSATHNWIADYKTNLRSISAPGQLSDPGPKNKDEDEIIDLQTIVSLYRDEPSFYNRTVWVVSGIFLAVWIYPVIRLPRSQEKDILCLAAIAAFSMLPVYHRVYDSRALLILFPAVALLLQRTRWWGIAASIVTVLLSVSLADSYTAHTRPLTPFIAHFRNHRIFQITLIHAAPLVLLGVTVFYLAVLYVYPPSLAREAAISSGPSA
jgi:hypothetical protein